MIRNLFLFVIAFLFFTNYNVQAQVEKDSTDDEIYNDEWYDSDYHEWFDWGFHGKPFIEVNYGLGSPKQNKLISKFADIGLAEIKLGYASSDSFYKEIIIKFNDKFSFVSRLGTDLKSSNQVIGNMRSDMWQFGFGKRSGYGYKIRKVSILPYYSSAFSWSRLHMIDYPAKFYLMVNPPMSIDDAITDTDILNRYHDAFRFGTVNEAGVRIDIAKFASIDAGYETAVIFPRHLFWKHLGSMVVEGAATSALDYFVREIADSSPYAAPIVNFVLKNGLSYAFYSLKKENMNWPFSTESPLTYETFKVGVTFTF